MGHVVARPCGVLVAADWIIAFINLVVLIGIFRRMRRSQFDEAELEDQLNNRGVMNRFLGG